VAPVVGVGLDAADQVCKLVHTLAFDVGSVFWEEKK
jgi:hypothetical protein